MLDEPRTPLQSWGELTCGQSAHAKAIVGDVRDVQAVSSGIAKQLIRNSMFKGSDVRMASGVLTRPDLWPRRSLYAKWWNWKVAFAFKQSGSHINVLELRAVLKSVVWKLRSSVSIGKRHVHATVSQVCLGVLVKGRSSSRQLNHLLHKVNCLVLAGSLQISYVFVQSSWNPADTPSRWRSLKVA